MNAVSACAVPGPPFHFPEGERSGVHHGTVFGFPLKPLYLLTAALEGLHICVYADRSRGLKLLEADTQVV